MGGWEQLDPVVGQERPTARACSKMTSLWYTSTGARGLRNNGRSRIPGVASRCEGQAGGELEAVDAGPGLDIDRYRLPAVGERMSGKLSRANSMFSGGPWVSTISRECRR